MATVILKKLTLRDLCGGKLAMLKVAEKGQLKGTDAEGKETIQPIGRWVPLARIIGHVTSVRPGQSDNGPFIELRGSFKGTNLDTGEIIPNCAKCILPNTVGDLVFSAIQDAGGKPVDFAVDVNVRYAESAAVMYEFQCVSLQDAKPADSVAAIEASLGLSKPALAAPNDPPKIANAPVSEAPAPAPTPEPEKVQAKGKTERKVA